MNFESILSLSLAIFIIGALPGPAVLLVSTRTLQEGLRAGIVIISGIVLIDLVLLTFSLVGLSVVAGISPITLKIFSLIGAAFLIYLAWQSWNYSSSENQLSAKTQLRSNFIAGVLISLANPIFLYLALLPTFIDLPKISLLDILFILLIVATILALTLLAYALIASKLGKLVASNKIELLNKIGALALIFLAGGIISH